MLKDYRGTDSDFSLQKSPLFYIVNAQCKDAMPAKALLTFPARKLLIYITHCKLRNKY